MSNKYVIRAEYQTGDSFSSEDTSSIFAPVWTDLAKVKQALKDLTEHHNYYKSSNEYPHWDGDTKVDISDLTTKPWYRPDPEGRKYRSDFWIFSANVELDDGSKHTVHIPYHGYFEHLRTLEIITEPLSDSDLISHF